MTTPTVTPTAAPGAGSVPRLSRVVAALLAALGVRGWARVALISALWVVGFGSIARFLSAPPALPRGVADGLGIVVILSGLTLGVVVEGAGAWLRTGGWLQVLPRAAPGWLTVHVMVAGVHAVAWGIVAWGTGVGALPGFFVPAAAFGVYGLGVVNYGAAEQHRWAAFGLPIGLAALSGAVAVATASVMRGLWLGLVAALGMLAWAAVGTRLARRRDTHPALPRRRKPRQYEPLSFGELRIEDPWFAYWLPGPRFDALASARRAMASISVSSLLAGTVFFLVIAFANRAILGTTESTHPPWWLVGMLTPMGLLGVPWVRTVMRTVPPPARVGGGARWLGERMAAIGLTGTVVVVVVGVLQLVGSLILGFRPIPVQVLAVGFGLLATVQAAFELVYELLGSSRPQEARGAGPGVLFATLFLVAITVAIAGNAMLNFGIIGASDLFLALAAAVPTLYALAYALHARRLRAGDFV